MVAPSRTLAMHDEPMEFSLSQLQWLARFLRCVEHRRVQTVALQLQLARLLQWGSSRVPRSLVVGATILVADDAPAVRAVSCELLQALGYRAFASDARLRKLPRDVRFDAVLIDALDLAQLHRVRHARHVAEKVAVCTPLPVGPAHEQLRQAGAGAILQKPLEPWLLVETLDALLMHPSR